MSAHESHFVEGFDGRVDLSLHAFGAAHPQDRQVNNWTTRVRGHVEWDARTQTDFGLIRAFIALEGTRGPATSPSTASTFPIRPTARA